MGTFSKFINLFKSLRLNTENNVVGQHLNYLLISSMYAEQQAAYLNSYETGLKIKTITSLLADYWSIHNKVDAWEILIDLQNRNQDGYLDVVFNAFENKENYVAILKENLPQDEDLFADYLAIYRALNKVIPELIEAEVIASFEEVKIIKNTGWNYGRGAFVARCCYDLGYLSKEELKIYLENSYKGLKNYCRTWKEYTLSYILGRALWGGPHNSGMIHIAHDLLHKEKSPLKDKVNL